MRALRITTALASLIIAPACEVPLNRAEGLPSASKKEVLEVSDRFKRACDFAMQVRRGKNPEQNDLDPYLIKLSKINEALSLVGVDLKSKPNDPHSLARKIELEAEYSRVQAEIVRHIEQRRQARTDNLEDLAKRADRILKEAGCEPRREFWCSKSRGYYGKLDVADRWFGPDCK